MTTGSVLAQFTITLSQAVSEHVAVEWHTSDGTALAGVDYAAAKGTVLFAPGETAKNVDILVHGRAIGSEDRSFFVEMLPPTNAILGASIGECIIHVDTTGSTPVTQIIVPAGPQGLEGDSAYQVWLDLGNAGTEQDFIDSLKPSAEEIAEEVAPLLNVGNSPVTADGTETLSKPDNITVKRLARRVAYVGAAKVATVVLADGDNLITHADLSGDEVDFKSVSLYPRILRGTAVISPQWNLEPDEKILIKNAISGDLLYICQYDLISERAITNVSETVVAPVGRQALEALRRSYAEAGYNVVGTFRAGFSYVSANDVGIDDGTGRGYTGPAGVVSPGTDPTIGSFVDVSTAGIIPMLYPGIRSYSGAAKTISCLGKATVFDGRYGTFDRVDMDTSSPDDDVMILVDAMNRRWKRRHVGALLPRFSGVIGDGVVDDYAACQTLITAFKKRGVTAPGGTDMRGDGIDWTGYKCRLSQKLDLSGLFNYNFVNPSFIAHSDFTGTALLRIDSDHTYLASGITWLNPQLDAAWLADYCVEAYDFLKWTLVGGKFTHYKKKGFITGTVHDAPHEANVLGTFFFQREYNETFPPSVTEGEAWELNNYDNEFSNVVIGYHKQWAFTNNKGANRFMGGHIYTGHTTSTTGGARSLDSDDEFIGTYFDNTWLQVLKTRSTISLCKFAVNASGIALKLGNDPYRVKVTNNRFRKSSAGSTNVIEMPTVAAGRVSRPDIYDNTYEGCTGPSTRGNLFNAIWASPTTIPVPDEYLPVSTIGAIGKPASATGAFGDRIFSSEFDSATNQLTITCYKINTDGTVVPASLSGKSAIIPLNM